MHLLKQVFSIGLLRKKAAKQAQGVDQNKAIFIHMQVT